MVAWDSALQSRKNSSSRSSPQNPRVSAWGYQSAVPSSNRTRGGCGQRHVLRAAPFFSLPFPYARRIPMANPRPVIYVVDDDVSVRDAVSNLLESAGGPPAGVAPPREIIVDPRAEG